MMKHVAIFSVDLAEAILTGKKTIESRFAVSKIAPFGKVSAGDIVYIKPVGKDIIGQFRVQKVIFYDGLSPEDILEIKKVYGKQITADEGFWTSKMNSKYATLIFISGSTRFLTSPIKFSKRDQRAWVVLE